MPVVVAAGDDSNDNLPGHGGGTIAVQHDFPVVLAMREYCVGTHTHPECIFSNADSVAIVADVSLRMLQISIPEEGCVCVEVNITKNYNSHKTNKTVILCFFL